MLTLPFFACTATSAARTSYPALFVISLCAYRRALDEDERLQTTIGANMQRVVKDDEKCLVMWLGSRVMRCMTRMLLTPSLLCRVSNRCWRRKWNVGTGSTAKAVAPDRQLHRAFEFDLKCSKACIRLGPKWIPGRNGGLLRRLLCVDRQSQV